MFPMILNVVEVDFVCGMHRQLPRNPNRRSLLAAAHSRGLVAALAIVGKCRNPAILV